MLLWREHCRPPQTQTVSDETCVNAESPSSHSAEKLRCIGVLPPEAIQLFDYVQDVLLWMKDAKGHYCWINLAFLLNYGIHDRKDVLGRTDLDLSSLPLANQYRDNDSRVLQGERILSRVERVGRFDHTARWCVTSKVPLHDSRGRIVGTAGIARPLDGRALATVEAPLSPAIRFISEHYAEAITNQQLARLCGISVRALERKFLSIYHLTPHMYVRQLRVRISCNELVFSHKTLTELATECGFGDQSHFTREFRHFLGETPSAYRARYQPR
jgi:AraC-like DNA-binding protein